MQQVRCENVKRVSGVRNRGVPSQCFNNAKVTVSRDSGESKQVCGTCARSLTVGKMRTPTDPWNKQ